MVFVSIQFHEKLEGSAEVIAEFGGSTIGVALFYTAPNTVVLTKCPGDILIQIQLPDYAVSGDSPYIDIYFGQRDYSGNRRAIYLVVDGKSLEQDLPNHSIHFSDANVTGILQVAGDICTMGIESKFAPFTSGTWDVNFGVSVWGYTTYVPRAGKIVG